MPLPTLGAEQCGRLLRRHQRNGTAPVDLLVQRWNRVQDMRVAEIHDHVRIGMPLQPGQLLRDSDKAVTADGARMLLRLPDRSAIRLGEQTQLQIQSVMTQQQGAAGTSEIKSSLRLITGVFRYATDYTSKALGNTRELNLEVATATVGIRGTDFWAMSDAAHDAVCVFEGAVAVERDGRDTIALNQPGAFWVVFTGQPEQPAGQATPAQLK